MAAENYTKEDLTRVLCNAFKSFLHSADNIEAHQVACFMEGILDPYLSDECSIHCMVNTKSVLLMDLKLQEKNANVIELFSAICEAVNSDDRYPAVTYGVYVRIDKR